MRAQQTNKQTNCLIITKAQGRACKSAQVWYWEPPSLRRFNRALRRHSWGTVMLWNHRAETKTTFVSSGNCELQLNVVPKNCIKASVVESWSCPQHQTWYYFVESNHATDATPVPVKCIWIRFNVVAKSEKYAIYICVRVCHSKSCRTVPAKSIWRSLSMWTVSSLCHVSTGG